MINMKGMNKQANNNRVGISGFFNNKYIKTFEKYNEDDNFDEDNEGGDFELYNFSEQYFTPTISDTVKENSNEYRGRGVAWYGIPKQMVVVHKDYVDETYGEQYEQDKLDFVEQLIVEYPDYVEFECDYAHGSVVSFQGIVEHQESIKIGEFQQNYGNDNPLSIGDSELDDYIGSEELSDNETIDIFNLDDVDLYDLLNNYRLFLVRDTISKKNLDIKVNDISKEDGLSENDRNLYKDFIKIEERVKEAFDNDEGDLNTFRIQLRNGHHRVMGAINSGENYVCMNLDENHVKEFKTLIDNEVYINFVS